jgi:hypothetical protein
VTSQCVNKISRPFYTKQVDAQPYLNNPNFVRYCL